MSYSVITSVNYTSRPLFYFIFFYHIADVLLKYLGYINTSVSIFERGTSVSHIYNSCASDRLSAHLNCYHHCGR